MATPPKQVRVFAKRGLRLARQYNRGSIPKSDAESLLSRRDMAMPAIRKMRKFFENRPEGFRANDRDPTGGPSEAAIDYLMLGGRHGDEWSRGVASRDPGPIGKSFDAEIIKVDKELGIIFGYAIISRKNGDDYYDSQGDHIPESAMIKAAAAFMEGARDARAMHGDRVVGKVIFGFPLTADIASALEIAAPRTGLIVGMKPGDEELESFKAGKYTGFSIGGQRVAERVIE